MKNRGATLISFILAIGLTVAGIGIITNTMFPAIEKTHASGVLNDAIQQMKILDTSIAQLAERGVGSKTTFDLKVNEGQFIIDNTLGAFKFDYETTYVSYLQGLFKKVGNLVLIGGGLTSVTCSLRYGSCNTDESCLFSVYRETNSHLGNCSTYDYKVCCSNLQGNLKEGACSSTETKIFSIFKQNGSHGGYYGNYNVSVCVTPQAVCALRSACKSSEVCVVSFYNDQNSHAARCGYYTNQLCCNWEAKAKIEVALEYDNINITGEGTFPKGEYNLCLEKISDDTNPIISITSC